MRLSAILSTLLLFCSLSLSAQESERGDSLIRLISASRASMVKRDSLHLRKVIGPATFLHNDTYLLCDSALWSVDQNYIDAIGNVKIIQNNTTLSGDRLHYKIKENIAQFRGTLVELRDKEGNLLRTKVLDFNTKDSVGTFFDGGSMLDKDGNVMESLTGMYESKKKLFTFYDRVEMYSDSLFIVTDTLRYQSKTEIATFGRNTRGWKDDGFIHANGGWYEKKREYMYFCNDVYIQTKEQEIWCDELYFERNTNNAELYKNIQMIDTKNEVGIMREKFVYTSKPKFAEVTENPVFISFVEENGVKDTIYCVADTLRYYTQRMCDIDSSVVAQAKKRRELIDMDPYEGAKKNMVPPTIDTSNEGNQNNKNKNQNQNQNQDQNQNLNQNRNQNMMGPPSRSRNTGIKNIQGRGSDYDSFMERYHQDTIPKKQSLQSKDSLGVKGESSAKDSLALGDTLAPIPIDTIPPPPDTSQVAFVIAYHKVKVFKRDLQVLCDSLIYTGIDSIARLYKEPVIWNDIKNQFLADSIQLVIKDKAIKKANLLSNAFVSSKETEIYFNQVKSPEMIAYFQESKLSRFDAMGGVNVRMCLTNDDKVITTLNKKESKLMSARLKKGNIEKIYYLEDLKQDVLPIYDLNDDDLKLKNFVWRGDERPETRFALTERVIIPTRRDIPIDPFFPIFRETERFFPKKFVILQNLFIFGNKQ